MTADTASRPRIGNDSQGYSEPPQLSTSRNAVTPPVSSAAPPKSILPPRLRTGSSLSARLHSHIAARPNGTLIQNTNVHEIWSVNQPPTTGPATEAMPQVPAM